MSRWCVDVGDGIIAQFDRKPTPAMIAQAHETLTALRDSIPPLTDEQAARQDVARHRIAERNRRLRGEVGTAVMLYCGHDLSLTGAEGPVRLLGRWPILWSCDTCGAVLLSDLDSVLDLAFDA